VTLQHAVYTGNAATDRAIAEVETDKWFRQPGTEKTLVNSIYHGDERLFSAGCEAGEKGNSHSERLPVKSATTHFSTEDCSPKVRFCASEN
jgi:hypothetical protein